MDAGKQRAAIKPTEVVSPGWWPRTSAKLGGIARALASTAFGKRAWRWLKRWIDGPQFANLDPRLTFFWERTPPEEWKMLTQAWDDSTPLPADAAVELRADHPRLAELRRRYGQVTADVLPPWMWSEGNLDTKLDLLHFRGDSPYIWQYRDLPRVSRLKFYLAGRYVQERDTAGLLTKLGEDGAFGCWTYQYPGLPRISRELLDSANELLFLDRHMGLLSRRGLRVLDIGAGYGRLAHRVAQAVPGVADYCCTDAIPESTFLCDYYLRHRKVAPPARVVPLDEVDRALDGASFDIAFNVHSFSECTYKAVAWWMDRVARLQVPLLFIVPNEGEGFLSTERDESRQDLLPLIDAAGYELVVREATYEDAAVRQLLGIDDHYHLYRRRGGS